MSDESVAEGWRQIAAGIALISWSRLARWQASDLVFCPVEESEFESSKGHKSLHPKYGRLICWLSFAVGGEYLAKGICLVSNLPVTLPPKTLIKPPNSDDDIEEWVSLAYNRDPAVMEEEPQFKTLSNLPVGDLFEPGPEQQFVLASIRLLASRVRNRDAHRYAENERTFQFHTVRNLFVPTFNKLLSRIDQEALRHCLNPQQSKPVA